MADEIKKKTSESAPLALLKIENRFTKLFLRNNFMTLLLWGFLIWVARREVFPKELLVACVGSGMLAFYIGNHSKLYTIAYYLDQKGGQYGLFDEDILKGVAVHHRAFFREIGFFLLVEPFFQYLPFKIGADHILVLIFQYRWVLFGILMLKNLFHQLMTGIMVWIQEGLIEEMKSLTEEEQVHLMMDMRERMEAEDQES